MLISTGLKSFTRGLLKGFLLFNGKDITYKEPASRCTKAIVALLLLVLVFQCVMSLRQKSSTWDETHYLGIGKYLLTHFAWDIKGSILHPPLTYFLHDIPLLFFSTPEIRPLDGKENRVYLGAADLERGNRILMSDRYDGETLFSLARFSMLPLSFLLGIFVFMWARELYSTCAGLLSLFLYCFSPNILAHSRLITPDISLVCFSFMSIYFYWKFTSGEKKYRHLFLAALGLGLALTSKYSALLLFPVFIIIFTIDSIVDLLTSSYNAEVMRRNFFNLIILFGLGSIPVLILYKFDLSPYFDGIVFQLRKSEWGHAAFLNGTISWKGWWYFLLYAYFLKTPIPALMFLVMSISMMDHRKYIFQKKEFYLIVPVVSFFIFFTYNHNQCIGLRYILPVYPFLFVYMGRILRFHNKTRKVLVGLLLGMGVWYLVGTIRIYPHYLAYFNEFAGGPSNGYTHLVDSNLDWGQDLKLLKRYMDMQGIEEIYLDYFGSVDPAVYDIQYKEIDENTFPLPKGWCGVSATNLQGVYSLARESAYAELKKKRPVTQIGYSIFLYHID